MTVNEKQDKGSLQRMSERRTMTRKWGKGVWRERWFLEGRGMDGVFNRQKKFTPP